MHSSRSLTIPVVIAITALAVGCGSLRLLRRDQPTPVPAPGGLRIVPDEQAGTISVFRADRSEPILIMTAPPEGRPYLHPIAAPDGKGVIGEGVSFAGAEGNNWRRISVAVVPGGSDDVQWQTVYDLVDASGGPRLTETQRWSMRERDGTFVLGLERRGDAKTGDPVVQADYGGPFVQALWRQGSGEVVNAARQRNERADGQRAMWIDLGLQLPGRDDLAHVAVFDYPDNTGYPQAWRVDSQRGVGLATAPDGDRTIKKGQVEISRYQFVIYTGALSDVAMERAWAAFSGNRSTYATSALWGIAQREGRSAKFLTAEEAVAEMSVVDGYKVNAWAAEPMVVQPMAFCWDDRGRLWVAENRDYESRSDGFSNGGNSRILILEDTDHDGVADSRKVFMDGIVFPSALAVGFDGVFVGAPPNLLFVPDRDGDDKADSNDIEVRLTGWGINDRHEVINSLHWGPDGWLYGLQGYATSSKVRKPSGKGRLYDHREPFPEDVLSGEGTEINGGVWRYHPTKDVFEVVAHGFSNPWGIDYDAKGQLLISACVIPHLFHVIPGGIYQRQGGQHFNPYVYSDIQTIADHRHRSAHGGARVYQSDAFPASQQGRIFMANIHEHALLSDVLERKGSGFTAHHGDDFLMANNAQWIGFSVEIGPDGALYVLDWHDSDICGNDVLHKETGRIFRVAPKQSLAEPWPGRYADLGRMTDAQLVDLQTTRSDWHARRARVILQNRAAKGTLAPATVPRLLTMFRAPINPDWRLRVMWTLHVVHGWTADGLVAALSDADDSIRAWAIQLLCEDRSPPPAAVEKFAQMAREDRSPVVRLYLASALQRLTPAARWTIATPLMAHAEDAEDQNLPKLIWLGVEPLVKDNPAFALERAGSSRIPMLARFIARRTVDSDAVDRVVAAIATMPATEISMLEGLRDGLEGRFDVPAPANWRPLYDRLKRSQGPAAVLGREVAQQFGDADATAENMRIVSNKKASTDERRRALQTLTLQRRPQLARSLPAILDEARLRSDAIRAIAAFDNEALGKLLIARYPTFDEPEKAEAIRTLSSRGRYGRMLTDALASNVIPRRDLPPHVARQLRRIVGTRFADVWGPVDVNATEEKAYSRYRGLLTDGAMATAHLQDGAVVFQRTCGPCHKMYGEGGAIGPDLTGSNRANLEYLLFNVLNPNGEVPDAYKMVVVTTRDGRTFSGNVVAETDRALTLRVVGRGNAVVTKSDIQSRETTAVSMMPTGLFDALTDREVIDLVAYLRSVPAGKSQ